MTLVIRPGRALMTTTRVERKTASGIEWVTKMIVVAGPLPDPEQLEVHPLAGHLVERPERLVHQDERRVERERAGDRRALLHAARELPGVVLAEVAELDELEHLARLGLARRLVAADDLERQLDVASDRAPVEQDRRLEDHPVVAVEAGLVGRLAVDGDRAARRRGQVGDDPQQRALAAARRPDERDELAAPDGQVDAPQGLDGRRALAARLERLADVAQLDDDVDGAGSGDGSWVMRTPRRVGSCEGPAARRGRPAAKAMMPTSAHITIAAHRSSGENA